MSYTGEDLQKEIEELVQIYCWDFGIEYHNEIQDTAYENLTCYELNADSIPNDEYDEILNNVKARLNDWGKVNIPFAQVAVNS
jgi:hypothetical protein